MNRTLLANGNTQIEDFAASSCRAQVGDAMELPMNAWGSVVKRFTVVAAREVGVLVVYELAAA